MLDTALIIVPAWNEATTLPQVLEGLGEASKRCSSWIHTRVLVVDDGSVDSTAAIAADSGCEVIRHRRNLGYGAALRTGFDHARVAGYDYAITIDADGQHRASDVTKFLASRRRGAVISGSRYLPQSIRMSAPPAPLVNALFTALVNLSFSLRITDVGCGQKCIDVKLLRRMRLYDSGYFFPVEFWRQCQAASATISELPVPMIYRDPGRNLAVKFGSVEAALDRATHFLVCQISGVEGAYSRRWGCMPELRWPATPEMAQAIEAVGRELHLQEWDALPLRLARTNIASVVGPREPRPRRPEKPQPQQGLAPC